MRRQCARCGAHHFDPSAAQCFVCGSDELLRLLQSSALPLRSRLQALFEAHDPSQTVGDAGTPAAAPTATVGRSPAP